MLKEKLNLVVEGMYQVDERFCRICGRLLEWDRMDCYCFKCRQRYKKEWDLRNKEHNREYKQQWNLDNREHIQEYQKEYRELRTQDQYIYIIKGARDGDIYIGSTSYKDRCVRHLKGQTHLQLEPRDWLELEVEKIQYINITDFIDNTNKDIARAEREYIEGLMIEDIQPLENDTIPSVDVDADRMEELREICYNDLTDWEEISIKKITTPNGAVTFNYSDLKFKS